MTKSELVNMFRIQAKDTEPQKYLWPTAELEGYLVEAEREAADRADLLEEDSDPTYCELGIPANTAVVNLNPLVNRLRQVRLADGSILKKKTSALLDLIGHNWRAATGDPRYYIHTLNKLRVTPVPTVETTLYLEVTRFPVVMADTGPEIHFKYHEKLVHWMMYRAYSKQDADTFNAGTAEVEYKKFEIVFGESQSANTTEQRVFERPVHEHDNRPTWF